MWGKIVGFGKYHYKYASGREGDSMLTGFAARKAALTLYIMSGFDDYDELRQKLGKFEVSMHGEAEMDLFTYPDWVFPTGDMYWHGQIGKWYQSNGAKGACGNPAV